MYYYRARYFDPGSKRFTAEDPIGVEGGLNSYSYVSQDPLNRIDPFGLTGIVTNAVNWYWDVANEQADNGNLGFAFFLGGVGTYIDIIGRTTGLGVLDVATDRCKPFSERLTDVLLKGLLKNTKTWLSVKRSSYIGLRGRYGYAVHTYAADQRQTFLALREMIERSSRLNKLADTLRKPERERTTDCQCD